MRIITGIGRSGTSFVSEICKNLGYDMGFKSDHKNINAGYELPAIVSINDTLILEQDDSKTVEIYSQMVKVASETVITKDPRFILTLSRWVDSGANIESILYCKRDFLDIAKSSNKSKCGMLEIFALKGWPEHTMATVAEMWEIAFLDMAKRYGIPVDIISFPESLSNFNQVSPLKHIESDKDKLYSIWKKTIKPVREYSNVK